MQTSVFFYGLFMDTDALRQRGFHPGNSRHAFIRGRALRIGHRATVIADPFEAVYGVVVDLPSEDLDRLYAEPSVAAYRPEILVASLLSGESITVSCYTLPDAPLPHERNPEYAARLRDLCRRLDLPSHYIDTIR